MANDTKEIKIKTPTKFKGDKDKMTKFIHEIKLYLYINGHLYDTDKNRIMFALSFMTDSTAAAWKEAYMADKTVNTRGFAFRSWGDFLKVFKEGFAPIDEAGNACLKLKTSAFTHQSQESLQTKCLVNISWMVSSPDSLKRYSLWKSSVTITKYAATCALCSRFPDFVTRLFPSCHPFIIPVTCPITQPITQLITRPSPVVPYMTPACPVTCYAAIVTWCVWQQALPGSLQICWATTPVFTRWALPAIVATHFGIVHELFHMPQ